MFRINTLPGGEDDKPHLKVVTFKSPENREELQGTIVSLAKTLVEFSQSQNVPLDLLAYSMVSEEGVMPHIIKEIAETMGEDKEKVGFAFLAALGKSLSSCELNEIKCALEKEGLDPDDFSKEWLLDWRDKNGSLTYTACQLRELTCDCPSCILFWTVKRFLDGMSPGDLVDEFKVVIEQVPERGNAGCVRHKIADSDSVNWERLE
jgi:hypothetical protein